MDKEREYNLLSELERSTNATRHTTFTALLSISFLLPGLALQAGTAASVPVFATLTIQKLVFALGFMFFCFAAFHYSWYHRYSHRYRKALKSIERELGINVYRLRQRPRIGPFKFHFEWALWILGLFYGGAAAIFVGAKSFFCLLGVAIAFYLLLFFISFCRPEEPLEQ